MLEKLPIIHRFVDRDYPRLVSIETTNRCNAKCTFCPNNALARDRQTMPQELFEKIVEDCREFPLDEIEPFLQGDPLMDPHILPRLEHINRRLPDTKLRLYTNGYALTPKRIDALCELDIFQLSISLNTLDPDKYRQVMGLELKRTLDNLAYLTAPVRRSKVAGSIIFRMTRLDDTTRTEEDRFLAYCRERGVQSRISGLFNYKGDIASDLPVPSYGCEHITRLDILASGKVTLCCMDQNGEYSWGDVNQESVLEVYRGAVSRRYRDAHMSGRRRHIVPCDTCNNFWPDLRSGGPIQSLKVACSYGLYYARHRPSGRRAS